MIILNIDTSCDETAAAITSGRRVLSNTVWSQASLHAKWGGVMPSLAQRKHKERIDWVITQALKQARVVIEQINAIAVTTTPGLAIALEVGINKAKKLSLENNKPLISINHIEAHLLSPLLLPRTSVLSSSSFQNLINFPSLGLVVSGGNTIFVLMEDLGRYKILARTVDDALGEALDKGARLLGLGYPGGAILEKFAKNGDINLFKLPIPMSGKENEHKFSYSGLKTALYSLINKNQLNNKHFPDKEDTINLSASYQDRAFLHLIRVLEKVLVNIDANPRTLFVGGGVCANTELRKRLRSLAGRSDIKVKFPYNKRFCSDNAAMLGIVSYYKYLNNDFTDPSQLDREPRLKEKDGYLVI